MSPFGSLFLCVAFRFKTRFSLEGACGLKQMRPSQTMTLGH
ncbi:hypothetical protein GCHA_2819 [Paraglaciecola chathamensis S18K6]|uniref:Uncharacterized protein n=1 Tax=Paraglaciecola chathamensis S18K6 TaxID=1127672 RepID=A0AAV3V163_9ALTE|nr:hypothetical protein GCHA_2819 [Paraglaciecola chathamensis S18K6]